MKRKLTKIIAFAMAMMILVSMLAMSSSAYIAFNSYNYNYYGEAIITPSGYAPEKVYYGDDLGIGVIEKAIDLYVSPQNEIYILCYDSKGAALIHILDSKFNHIKTLSTLEANGNPYKMKAPESLTVDKFGYIYVCDTGNKQVLKLDKSKSGKIVQTIGAPKTDMFTGDFKPSKVGIAKNMSIYVISTGTLDGVMEFNPQGVFLRYFGAPAVKMSVVDMVTLAWRRVFRSLMGKNADNTFITFVPTEFANLIVDEYGFVYTVVSAAEGTNTDQLTKMNFMGNSILDPTAKSTQKINTTLSRTYGDLVRRATAGQGNVFTDVAVDDDGFFTLLDSNLCKVFEYDSEGNLTFVYGAKGSQQGLFQSPVGIAKLGKKTLILDAVYGSLTVYDLTDYGKLLHQGIEYYDRGLYDQAEGYWVEVLKSNANCELAHIGLGKVYYQNGRYEEALHHFKIANDRMNYQDSFALYRENLLADNFGLLMTGLVVLVVIFFVWHIWGKKIIAAIKNKVKGGGDDDNSEMAE